MGKLIITLKQDVENQDNLLFLPQDEQKNQLNDLSPTQIILYDKDLLIELIACRL